MGFLALLNHAINFLAPAVWLALLMPLSVSVFIKKRPVSLTLSRQFAIHFAFGCLVLLVGLVVFGRDGKMLTYLALVLSGATCQWFLLKGGRAT